MPLSGKERKLCAHPRLEIYQHDQICFMCPLARQGDFYVPEVKETERKSRGPAEASDAQVDGTGMEAGDEVVAEAPPWLDYTGSVQAVLGQGGRRRPARPRALQQSCLFPDTWVHVGVESATDAAVAPDSLQMQQEYLGNRSQATGYSWEGAESAQDKHHLGRLIRK